MARLTSFERKRLRKSSFALPKKRAYPIPDKSHARNALARVSQFGTPEEKAKVRAAVHRKFLSSGRSRPAPRQAGAGGTGKTVPLASLLPSSR